MSENKNVHKVLVRNTSVPIRPCKITEKPNNLKKVHFSDDISSEGGNQLFGAPEFCTLLQLADEMKAVRNTRCSTRSLPEIPKYRNLNFLPEEKLYQDLVGVDLPEKECLIEYRGHPSIKLKKDPELDFNKYTKYDLQSEYFFISYAVPFPKKERTSFSGHSVYNKIAMWKEFMN